MAIALIIVSLLLVASLGWQLLSPRAAAPAPALKDQLEGEAKARQQAEAELEKKRKEFEDQKAALAEVKDQLKQAKRKLYEQKEAGKTDNDLAKAREAVERSASIQLEVVRSELAAAQGELQRLKAELELARGRKPAPAAQPAPAPVQRVIRELSEADKEKMERLEQQAAKDRAKASELEREVRRLKSRVETQNRVYVVTKGELDLGKDKFKALEKRLNRTLLENDLLRRAIKDLEAKSGVQAGRTELSTEEIAASDRTVEEKQAEETRAAEERAAKVKAEAEVAAAAAPEETAPTPPSPAS